MLIPLRPVLVAVVNDYPVVVAGLTTLLQPYAPQVQIRGYLGALPVADHIDVVLLDTFGAPDALDRVREVVGETGVPVLLYTWIQDQEQIDAALRAGAAGVLPKSLDAEEIMVALQATLAGQPPLPVPAPDETPMAAWPGQDHGLSARESETLCLVVSGLSNQEIARHSYLSINTVKTYIRTAYRKINAQNRTQAVLWGIDHGFRLDLAAAARDRVEEPERASGPTGRSTPH